VQKISVFSGALFGQHISKGLDKIGGPERFLEEGVVEAVGEFGEVVSGEPGDEQRRDARVGVLEDLGQPLARHRRHEHIGDEGAKGVVGIFEER
jgi:hypothetical protein